MGAANIQSDDNARLTTQFIHITVPRQTAGADLRCSIEQQLQQYGEPLRWAITAVDGTMTHVEAVVTVQRPAVMP